MKKSDVLAEILQVHFGLNPLIFDLQPLIVRQERKAVLPRHERQSEVQKGKLFPLHGNQGRQDRTGLFHPHQPFQIRLRLAQNEMGFRISGEDPGAWLWSQYFKVGSKSRAGQRGKV